MDTDLDQRYLLANEWNLKYVAASVENKGLVFDSPPKVASLSVPKCMWTELNSIKALHSLLSVSAERSTKLSAV